MPGLSQSDSKYMSYRMSSRFFLEKTVLLVNMFILFVASYEFLLLSPLPMSIPSLRSAPSCCCFLTPPGPQPNVYFPALCPIRTAPSENRDVSQTG